MENATKALLIAGGVLIAIIILSMFLMMYNRVSEMRNAQEEQKKIEQLMAYNAQFEVYNKKLMYGADVITLINKVVENNKKYPIKIYLGDSEVTNTNSIKGDKEKKRYTCSNMEYDENGRVSAIYISELSD